VLDEKIPLKHGVIGQETQGPGGFFMCLRAVNVMMGVADDLAAVAPKAKVFNYTNPVNLVAQAWTTHCDIPLVALCEGPIVYPRELMRDLGYVYEIHDHSLLEPEVYHSLLHKDPQIVCNSLFKIFHIEHVPPKIRQDLTEIITASRGGPTTTLHMMQLLSTTRVLPLNRRLLFFLNLVMIMRHIHKEVPLLRLQKSFHFG
jgi:hypothetical protein